MALNDILHSTEVPTQHDASVIDQLCVSWNEPQRLEQGFKYLLGRISDITRAGGGVIFAPDYP